MSTIKLLNMNYNSTIKGTINALLFHLKVRNDFSHSQFLYLAHKLVGRSKKVNALKIRTLKKYIGLTEDIYHYFLDNLVFQKPEEKFTEAFIGMCLDIYLKDEFFELKDKSLRDNIKNKLQFYFYQEGAYETEKVQVEENDTVIDAGANMGMFSILAAKKGAKVYAFEPQGIFNDYLVKNLKLNRVESNVFTSDLAISSQAQKANLSVNAENLLSASININRNGDFFPVNCTSIDRWVEENNINRIDFIKADIEGAERLLLDGAKQTLVKYRPKLAIATYHLPDDKEVLKNKIQFIYPDYNIVQTRKILFAY